MPSLLSLPALLLGKRLESHDLPVLLSVEQLPSQSHQVYKWDLEFFLQTLNWGEDGPSDNLLWTQEGP